MSTGCSIIFNERIIPHGERLKASKRYNTPPSINQKNNSLRHVSKAERRRSVIFDRGRFVLFIAGSPANPNRSDRCAVRSCFRANSRFHPRRRAANAFTTLISTISRGKSWDSTVFRLVNPNFLSIRSDKYATFLRFTFPRVFVRRICRFLFRVKRGKLFLKARIHKFFRI